MDDEKKREKRRKIIEKAKKKTEEETRPLFVGYFKGDWKNEEEGEESKI